MPRLHRSAGRALAALALLASALCLAGPAVAATTPRYAHVAAYMIDGRIIVAGGIDATNTVLNTVEILDTQHGSAFVVPNAISAAAPMGVARASATINVLPNGNILVTGGWDGSIARTDAEVYSPTLNSWTTVGGMSSGRFNHTASLLNTGQVLVCGGQTGAGAAVTGTCDLFIPSGAGGSFSGTYPLLLPRSLHTATVLRDGTVWIAGGWNPGLANGGWVVTTERYTPGSGWQSAQPLNAARAFHTATLTGDNKVLVTGGYNGRDFFDTLGYPSKGVLATSEIFDPSGGTIVPGPPMNARVQKHTSVLQGSGDVVIFGGVGNIPSSIFSDFKHSPATFNAGSTVSGTFVNYTSAAIGTNSNHNSTSGSGSITNDFYLGTPVTGEISDGEIQFTSPTVTLSGGALTFVSASPLNQAIGLRVNLAGVPVGCDVNGVCGYINSTFNLLNMGQGTYTLTVGLDSSQLLPNQPVTGTLNFTPATLTPTVASGIINGGSVSTRIQLGVPSFLAGQTIGNITCTLTPTDTMIWTEDSSYTVTLNGGVGTAAGTYAVITAGSADYIDIPSMTFNGLAGSILCKGAGSTYSISSGFTVPLGGVPTVPSNLLCQFDYSASGIDIAGATLKYSYLTAVVRNMLFGDKEWFNPSQNSWGFNPPNAVFTRPYASAEGATTVLTPQDDLFDIGGRFCTGATCASYIAANNGANRQDEITTFSGNNFTAGSKGDPLFHAFHSANLLPDGTIFIAGGTDGAYVLPFAETFDPRTGAFTPTASTMHTAREKHSANLLPNGRVLLAGGFATTAVSTGPTNLAEVYFPDTRTFFNTSTMISSHSQHSAVTMPSGNVFVAGGYNNLTSVTGVAEVYYATAAAWVQVASMPGGQERAIAPAVQLLDGRIMICGGTNASGNIATCIAYDPVANTWAALASMPTTLQGHTMTLLFDGRVLVAGGDDGFGETSSTFIYDPSGNTWATGNSLNNARFGHSATLLPNDTVMISGGVQQVAPIPSSPANALQTVEFFHPASESWNDGGGAIKFKLGPRAFHTATLGADGNVYFFGGATGSIGTTQSQAFYTLYESNYFTLQPDGDSRIQPSTRQSTITFVSPSPFLPNTTFTASGLRFRGATEASGGGAGSANASFNYPRFILQKIDGAGGAGSESSPGFVADLTKSIPLNAGNLSTLDTSLSVTLPATSAALPYGWYQAWISNNDVSSVAAPLVQVGPPKPGATIGPIAGATLGTSSITYTWAAIAPPLDGYEVFSSTSGLFLTTIPVSGSPSYTETNLLPNTTAGIIVAGYTITGLGPLTSSPTTYTLPNPPTGLYITSVTFNTLALEWNANLNLQGTIYEVGESSDNFVTSVSTPVPEILGLTDTFVTIQNLQPNTTYFFRVRAYNSAGLPSAWTPSVSTLTRTSVSGVAGVAQNPTSILWTWIPAGAVINYKVYNTTVPGQVLATPVAPTFLDTGLAIDSARSIQVSAVTPAGEGPLSPPTTVYTMAATPGVVPPTLTGLSTGSFTLQWAPNGNPNGTPYQILLLDYSTPTATTVSYTTVTSFTAGFGGLNPSTLFNITLSAINGDNLPSVPFLVGSTWTFARPPTNLQVLNTTPVSLVASWSNNFNSTNTYYQVTYATDAFFTTVSTAIPFSSLYNGSTVTINGLLTSTTYWLRVAAENAFGQVTSFSNVVATITFNGGAPFGSVAGVVPALGSSEFFGNLGNGRSIDIRSPGGSFPVDTTVTISSYDATVPLCPGGLNVAVSIIDNPVSQPTTPIYFTASYTPAELGAGPMTSLVFERFEPVSGTCVPLKTTFDTVHQTFTAQLNHFSFYELVAVPLATDANSLRIFPNPYRAATDSYVTFDQIPPASRVRVMTLRGETVLDATADGSGLLTWNATNGSGRSLASGLYIVVVESGGSKKITKMAVIR